MNTIVRAAPVGIAVDTSIKLRSRDVLDAIANHGFLGIIRTVPLPHNAATEDIDAEELEMILSHPQKFWSSFYQHPRYPGWRPGNCNAEEDAQCAVRYARAAGFPSGVHAWADAEGMGAATTEAEAISYYSTWCHVMTEEGYRAGVYAGYDDAMTAVDLYELHDATSYWSDQANRRVATRGTSILQGPQFEIMHIPFDSDTVSTDLRGELPMVVMAA